MAIVSYVLAALIVLVRVCVPISMTVVGGWPVRLALFVLWCLAIASNKLGPFLQTLATRWSEIACYVAWVGVIVSYWFVQGGEHSLTSYLLYAYIGMIPFYLLGTYYGVKDRKGCRMALAIGIVVGASCLLAIPTVWRNPEIVRMNLIKANSQSRAMGIGGYGDLTGFAISLPFFIMVTLQHKGVARLVGAGSCLATMALLLIATLSGTILLTGLAVSGCILYYLLLGGFRMRRIMLACIAAGGVGIAVVCVFPDIYQRPIFAKFYDKLAKTITNIPEIISGQMKDPTQRFTRMVESCQVFLENPLVGAGMWAKGTTTEGAGGHSTWMDAFANYGLLGGVPFLMFHLLVFRRLWRAWRRDRSNPLTWGGLLSCALYLLYGLFNVTSESTTVALFLYATASCGQSQKDPVVRRKYVPVRSMTIR